MISIHISFFFFLIGKWQNILKSAIKEVQESTHQKAGNGEKRAKYQHHPENNQTTTTP